MAAETARWMRRSRTVVTADPASVLMSVRGLAGGRAVSSRANATLTTKNAELDRANARVRARFDVAREAIDSFRNGLINGVSSEFGRISCGSLISTRPTSRQSIGS